MSPYFTEELRAGDELELRGPIGGYFVWEPSDDSPLMLIAGGSGVVPLRSMLRHRLRTGRRSPCRWAGPDEESMSMGTPDQESMSMGTPQEESMSMGTPDEPM